MSQFPPPREFHHDLDDEHVNLTLRLWYQEWCVKSATEATTWKGFKQYLLGKKGNDGCMAGPAVFMHGRKASTLPRDDPTAVLMANCLRQCMKCDRSSRVFREPFGTHGQRVQEVARCFFVAWEDISQLVALSERYPKFACAFVNHTLADQGKWCDWTYGPFDAFSSNLRAPIDGLSLGAILFYLISTGKLCMFCAGRILLSAVNEFWKVKEYYTHLQAGYTFLAHLIVDNGCEWVNYVDSELNEVRKIPVEVSEQNDSMCYQTYADKLICYVPGWNNGNMCDGVYHSYELRGFGSGEILENSFPVGMWRLKKLAVNLINYHPFRKTMASMVPFVCGHERFVPFDSMVPLAILAWYMIKRVHFNLTSVHEIERADISTKNWVDAYLDNICCPWLTIALGMRVYTTTENGAFTVINGPMKMVAIQWSRTDTKRVVRDGDVSQETD